MSRLRRSTAGAVAIAAVLAASACDYSLETVTPITTTMAVGTWVHDGPRGVEFRMTLRADGTYEMTDVPCALMDSGKLDWSCLRDGSGTWSIQRGTIGMATSGADAAVSVLEVDGQGSVHRLYVPIGGDEGNRFFIEKQ